MLQDFWSVSDHFGTLCNVEIDIFARGHRQTGQFTFVEEETQSDIRMSIVPKVYNIEIITRGCISQMMVKDDSI